MLQIGYDLVMSKTSQKKVVKTNRFIRLRSVVWYGPHECNICGGIIIKSSFETGGLMLDAPHDHHYPNHKWTVHKCVGIPEQVVQTPASK